MTEASLISGRLEPSRALLFRRGEEAIFPFGLGQKGLHECVEKKHGDMSALTGFVLANIKPKNAILWVRQHKFMQEHGVIFPSGFELFSRDKTHKLHVTVSKSMDALWAIEEGIKSRTLDIVIGELEDADFTATRRLKLASARYGTPVVLLMPYTRGGISACDARWRINAQPSALNSYDAKALGAPRWRAVLERCRSAPRQSGEVFELEYDDEALSLRVLPCMAAGSVAPREISAIAGKTINFRETA
ncbi:ImuA family protein [Hirschia litorea]|uniref:ImuA family protein n=1 Tax=Hirschia litorea TaxID=1199156 RepID=A0ABW2IP95_9PROT